MKQRKQRLILCLALFLVGAVGIGIYFNARTVVPMSYNRFMELAEQKDVSKVILSTEDNYMNVKLKDEKITYKVPNPKTDNFTEFLLKNDIDIQYGSVSGANGVLRVIFILLIGGVVIFIFKKNRKEILIEDAASLSNCTLSDIAGNIEAKAMVQDIIQFIQYPEKYEKTGAKMPRGILFYGPPGTGKTLMAKAIAGEAGVPFYAMSGSDFVQTYVGVGAGRVRDLFKKAKKHDKAVIFIDEIDAIGKKRGQTPSSSNDERDQTLNALLTEMSGFHEREGIIVIAATNRLDTLDEALTRPGRFDRQIEIGLPDIHARERILKLHSRTKSVSNEVSLHELAKSTVYFSGAMLENLLNEAAIMAANDDDDEIRQMHIDKAFTTIIAGPEKSDRSYITEKDRKITAFHEAGHALITKLLLPDNYISKVTIIPSVSGAGGFSISIPKDTLYYTKSQLESNIKVLFAGRIAEELVFGEENVTTGASNDITKASDLLVNYVGKYGMDQKMGLFHISDYESAHDAELLSRCRETSNLLYDETKELMVKNYKILERLASLLIQKENLNDDDIESIVRVEI